MAVKHNNVISKNHFRKQWQRRVRTHFDQPGRKLRRRNARLAKAAAVAPRPVDKLRPVVRCPTVKYNRRVREGRGFTFEELKEAKLAPAYARSIGIAVDHRRKNLSVEGLQANVDRLTAYKSKLILFPRKLKKPKAGDSTGDDLKDVAQVKSVSATFPVVNALGKHAVFTSRKIDASEREKSAYRELRLARAEHRNAGPRARRAQLKAEADGAKK